MKLTAPLEFLRDEPDPENLALKKQKMTSGLASTPDLPTGTLEGQVSAQSRRSMSLSGGAADASPANSQRAPLKTHS